MTLVYIVKSKLENRYKVEYHSCLAEVIATIVVEILQHYFFAVVADAILILNSYRRRDEQNESFFSSLRSCAMYLITENFYSSLYIVVSRKKFVMCFNFFCRHFNT